MTELIKFTDANQEVMTSLEIAEITGKDHKNVMRDIKVIIEQLQSGGVLKFEPTSDCQEFTFKESVYESSQGKRLPCYILTKKDCLLLASGYDVILRAKIINRWEELETKERAILPATYKDALLALVAKIEEQEHTQALLEAKAEELDESMEWFTIKRRALTKGVNWRAMKHLSACLGKEVKKAFDANYGQVNLYHLSVFEAYGRSAKIN